MKKLSGLILFIIVFSCIRFNSDASSNYQNYESVTMTSGKLLENFSNDDYKSYYKKVDKRKFMGWRVYKVNSNIKMTYISETLFSYYNDGYTAIDYTYKLDRKVSSKLALSASGSIGIKFSKDKQIFKNNLDGSLKLSADYSVSSEDKESYEINLKVDPGTQVDLYVYGEGKITNGVASKYFFWIRGDRGGYEIFLVTTQYQRLEKKKI
ncbi:MAG: hypothetical protein JXC31_05890 [Acholeplasmataceae bacterium]|nr:hypothetical protein [Acholeplasmataceae bacterium]